MKNASCLLNSFRDKDGMFVIDELNADISNHLNSLKVRKHLNYNSIYYYFNNNNKNNNDNNNNNNNNNNNSKFA